MKNIITNEIWSGVYAQFNHRRKTCKRPIDVGVLLAENSLPPVFNGINFSKTQDLKNLQFQEMFFINCNFTEVTFSEAYFIRANMKNCNFENANLDQAVLQNCLFENCDFPGLRVYQSGLFSSLFLDSKFLHSHFQNSSLSDAVFIRCAFQEADLVRCALQNAFFSSCNLSHSSWIKCEQKEMCVLRGKLNGACFWENTTQNYSLIDSDLAECLILENSGDLIIQNCTSHQVTKPVIAISWNFNARTNYTSIIARAIRDSGAIPLKVEAEPEEISPELLQQEVITLISLVKNKYPIEIMSISSEILGQASKDSEIGKIKSKIPSILQFCSGLSLSGGSDLQPEFYGAERDSRTDNIKDYRRSIVEFALLFYADQMNLPAMGTCRGAQLINIYFGGTLNQHVDHQVSHQKLQYIHLSESSRKDEFLAYFGSDHFPSFSVHHQAVDKVGKNLEIICEFEGVPKLLLSPNNQYIASQIHPEMYAEIDNLPENLKEAGCGNLIYKLFMEKVMEYKQKSKNPKMSCNTLPSENVCDNTSTQNIGFEYQESLQ